MTVKEIVKEYLEANGFDGLCTCDCGCTNDDLMPCCENFDDCIAGYKSECDPETCPADEDCDFHISAEKPKSPEPKEPGLDYFPDGSLAAEMREINKAWKKFVLIVAKTLYIDRLARWLNDKLKKMKGKFSWRNLQ